MIIRGISQAWKQLSLALRVDKILARVCLQDEDEINKGERNWKGNEE